VGIRNAGACGCCSPTPTPTPTACVCDGCNFPAENLTCSYSYDWTGCSSLASCDPQTGSGSFPLAYGGPDSCIWENIPGYCPAQVCSYTSGENTIYWCFAAQVACCGSGTGPTVILSLNLLESTPFSPVNCGGDNCNEGVPTDQANFSIDGACTGYTGVITSFSCDPLNIVVTWNLTDTCSITATITA
jgi:hypothetical protein